MDSKFNIDQEAVRKLAKLLEETQLGELEYEENGKRIRVAKAPPAPSPFAVSHPMQGQAPLPVGASESSKSSSASLAEKEGVVKSPMVGMVYLSPEPGLSPFVRAGDPVTVGQTLLIIEAMKVMNPIKSPKAGTLREVLVKDGQPVEYGEPLLIID